MKAMTKAFTLGATAFFVAGAPLCADLLIEAGGSETQGQLKALSAEEVTFQGPEGNLLKLPRSKVSRIEFHRNLSGTPAKTVAALNDPELNAVL